MTLPDLETLTTTGKLKREPLDQREFDGLVRLGEAKLNDAQVTSLSLEGGSILPTVLHTPSLWLRFAYMATERISAMLCFSLSSRRWA